MSEALRTGAMMSAEWKGGQRREPKAIAAAKRKGTWTHQGANTGKSK